MEGLFEKIPKLKELYRVRLRFKEIFRHSRRSHHGGALVEATAP